MKRVGLLILVLLCSATSLSYGQQDVIVEGPGHEVSEGTVIHPRVGVETGVISNLFYEEADPVVTPVLRFIAGLAISPQSNKGDAEVDPLLLGEDSAEKVPPKLDFRLGAELRMDTYPSPNERAREQTDLGGDLDGRVVVFPEGTVSFEAADRFTRQVQPRNFENVPGDDGNLNRDVNHLLLGLNYQPGGRMIRLGVRYENRIDRFESTNSQFASRLQQTIAARAQWKMLPITMISVDASFGFFGALGDSDLAGVPFKNSSNPVRVQLGVASAITETTTVRGRIGYGNGFYSSGQNFQNVIGGAEFGWRYSSVGRVRFSYEYDFTDSVNANFYRDHEVVLRFDQQLGVVVLGADLSARIRGYRGIPSSLMGPPSRDDLILAANARAYYLLRDWLALTGYFTAVADETDYRYFAVSEMDDPSYQRVELNLGVQAAF